MLNLPSGSVKVAWIAWNCVHHCHQKMHQLIGISRGGEVIFQFLIELLLNHSSPAWSVSQGYVVRVACSFDGRELKGTALDLLEGDLVQAECFTWFHA